ncbi:hypothetical protein RESH_04618 [Rhodopirellula europaea SH398]|uniref:Uncharacterized protein n=1 Tax=Rhodopirellula europaea SH398 TaxID=1263868 RepID=M5RZV3_9BACT|nr:hypothetical protein RESH_04618 [Rhodopirellula europaea SH398]
MVCGGTSFKTTLPAAHMLPGPTVTPGATKHLAATQAPSRTTIGRVIRSNVDFEKSCEPVHKNASCEAQQFDSIVT